METCTIVGIIPARVRGKGIPRKNLIDLCGKPLIFWSIEVAREPTSRRCVRFDRR